MDPTAHLAALDVLSLPGSEAAAEALRRFRLDILELVLKAKPDLTTEQPKLVKQVRQLQRVYQAELQKIATVSMEPAARIGAQRAQEEIAAFELLPQDGDELDIALFVGDYFDSLAQEVAEDAVGQILRMLRGAVLSNATVEDVLRALTVQGPAGPVDWKAMERRVRLLIRNETIRVANAAHYKRGMELDAATSPALVVGKRWLHASEQPGFNPMQGAHNRPHHVALSRETADAPIPIGTPFELETGFLAQYPHDPLLPASETRGCRCLMVLTAVEE